MMHTYLVSWYGVKQFEKPSIYPGIKGVEIHNLVGDVICKLDHPVCEDDLCPWKEDIMKDNELYDLPAIIAISKLGERE